MYRWLGVALLLSCGVAALAFVSTRDRQPQTSDSPTSVVTDRPTNSKDHPDEFARILARLATPELPDAPRYDPGYRLKEWDRAAKRLHRSATGTWTERGPFGFAGRARGLLVDPRDETGSTWWIASAGGGVWRTQNAGLTWQLLTEGLPTLAVQSLAMAPSNPDRVYAGTGESYLNVEALNGDGILVTEDGGATWRQLASTRGDQRFENVARIVVSPDDPDLLVVATTAGRYKVRIDANSRIMRSTDGGATWTQVHNETQGRRVLQIVADPRDFSVQYAAVDAVGIRKSFDAGLTWTDASDGITDVRGRFEIAISPVDPDVVFASAEGGGSSSQLWVSWDAGGSWQLAEPRDGGYHWLGGQGWFNNTIVCHPTDVRRVFVGGVELCEIRFDEAGALACTVTPLASYGWPHPDHHGLAIVQPRGEDWFLLGTNDGGVMRTARGVENFTMPIEGMTTTQFYGAAKRPGASAYVGGAQDHGTFLSTVDPRHANDWKLVLGGDGFQAVWHAQDPRRILISLYFNRFQRSLDGGITWEDATSGIEATSGFWSPFVSQLASSSARPDHVFAIDTLGILRSTDFGGSWSRPAMEGSLRSDAFLPRVCVSEADPDVVWGGQFFRERLAVSSDGGESFSRANTHSDRGLSAISGLATHPVDPDVAFALFSLPAGPKILRTDDRGGSWSDISGFGTNSTSATGFPDVAIYDLMVWPKDPRRIWVASEIGILESLDDAASWALYSDALAGVGVWQFQAREDEIVVATHGRGIWTYTDPTLEEGNLFSPLVDLFVQRPTGPLDVTINLRSVYDSTVVRLDGVRVGRHDVNTRRQHLRLELPPPARGLHTLTVESWTQGRSYASPPATLDASIWRTPEFAFATDFSAATDFFLQGCAIASADGFDGLALHSQHPYVNDESALALCLRPIWVLDGTRLEYREILLIEPGEEGVGTGNPLFFDYFVVEATSDGVHWIGLTPWRDARDDPEWIRTYESGESGRPELFRNRSIALREFFDRGDIVQIRMRFAADPGVVGWGWVIDDFAIVPGEGVDPLHPPGVLRLEQNVPNPFNVNTRIAFDALRGGPASLTVFDARGRRVRGLLDENVDVGPRSVVWDGIDDAGRTVASGVYVYELRLNGEQVSRRMTLVK